MKNREIYWEEVGPFVILPVLHHSYEFTLAAREAFLQFQPSAVALEYPFLLQDLILQAIDRLPKISTLIYGEARDKIITFEPIDPFVEVARLARQAQLPIRCIDLTTFHYPEIYQPLPDTYALNFIGHKKYCEMVLNRLPAPKSTPLSSVIPSVNNQTPEKDLPLLDQCRETAMAYHLRELEKKLHWTGKFDAQRPILVLCGLAHLKGLVAALQKEHPQPEDQRPFARLYHLSPDSLGEIMHHFPFFTAVYEIQRSNNFTTTENLPAFDNQAEEDSFAELADRMAEVTPIIKMPSRNLRLIDGIKPLNLDATALQAQHDTAQHSHPDRNEILMHYLFWCRAYYEQEIGDRLSPQQLFLLKKFARKYAHVKGHLLADFYELLIAGRGCLNAHFCYRMWEIGTIYLPQKAPSEIEMIELRAQDIFPFIRKVRMNPHAPLKPRSSLPRFLKNRDKQKQQHLENIKYDPHSICSYPPEDLVIEGYGQYLRSKGKNILSEERKRVRPFETSLLDGIDLRETIRNWHTGKLYVQESMMIKGEVDSLVVIFDEQSQNYPYTMTWLGEHMQESDMAFYATDPDARPVGPGIRKALYGGFMMTMPPGRLYDVFSDPAYRLAHNYAERLLLAALDYSLEKFVIYAAQKPPRPFFQALAGRYGKRILYIPLKQLSPVMLQKIRSFHILADKAVRQYAKDHIW